MLHNHLSQSYRNHDYYVQLPIIICHIRHQDRTGRGASKFMVVFLAESANLYILLHVHKTGLTDPSRKLVSTRSAEPQSDTLCTCM